MPLGRLLASSLVALSIILSSGLVIGEETPPTFVGGPDPVYPRELLTRQIAGTLELQLDIEVDGTATNVKVHKSSGFAEFDQAGIDAVAKWKFKPATKDGQPVKQRVTQPVRFKIFHQTELVPAPPLELTWKRLADLGDAHGFAGQYVGVSHGRLLLYGGSNFPDKPVWDGGVKRWYRDVYALDEPDAKWRKVGTLDDRYPSGYGAALTTDEGILCIGGADAARHFDDVFLLNYDGAKLTTRDLPKLPKPCAYLAADAIHEFVYAAGGTEKPDAVEALRTFWSLNLRSPKKWSEFPVWAGPGRMLPIVAADADGVWLIGGCSLAAGPDGKPVRTYLKETLRYRPTGWERMSDATKGIVAAPGPPIRFEDHLILLPGDDASRLGFSPPEKHPGFPNDIFAFDTKRNEWSRLGEAPFVPVCTAIVPWQGGYVVASGEIRPGVRSRETWFVTVKKKSAE